MHTIKWDQVLLNYYFISDLHIGGDDALGVCEFEGEFVSFLNELSAKSNEDIELIIVGDAFGLWEFTKVDGTDKFEALGACPSSHCSRWFESDSFLVHEQAFSPLEDRSDAAAAALGAGLR